MKASDFGSYLRTIRNRSDLSIRQLESLSGVSNAYLSQLENGKRNIPSPEILKKLSDHLDTTYEDMMKAAGYIENDEITEEIQVNYDMAIDYTFNNLVSTLINFGVTSNEFANIVTEKEFLSVHDLATLTNEPINLNPTLTNFKQSYLATITEYIRDELKDIRKLPLIENVKEIRKPKKFVLRPIPEGVKNKEKLYLFVVQDNAMDNSCIKKGATILVESQRTYQKGDIILVSYQDEMTLRRFTILNGEKFILVPDNNSFEPILYKKTKVKIIGKVLDVYFSPN